MEDYYGAFIARALDTDILFGAKRTVGTVHMGAITIECLLKSLIVDRHNIDRWGSNKDGTSHGITNPGHDLVEAIHMIPELRKRIPVNMMTYFEKLQQPRLNYIDMRYDGNELNDDDINEWMEAFKRVRAWLLAQKTFILSRRRR